MFIPFWTIAQTEGDTQMYSQSVLASPPKWHIYWFSALLAAAAIGCGNAPVGNTATATGQLVLSAQAKELRPGGSTPLTLSDTRTFPKTISWQLSCGTASESACGTIDVSTSIYTAPNSPPAGNQVTITASAPDGENAELIITLDNPIPEITAISPSSVAVGTSVVTIDGSGFVPGSVAQIESGQGSLSNIEVKSSTTLTATLAVPVYASGDVEMAIANPGPGANASSPASVAISSGAVSYDAAVRFLRQATFGPTPDSIAQVQQIGFAAFIDKQFSEPASLYPWDEWDRYTYTPSFACNMLFNAVNGPDQLRQRMSFALSQIIVASSLGSKVNVNAFPTWDNVLQRDALSTYPQLLTDALQSYALGVYLDNIDNLVTSPNEHASQNLGRELLQLFTIGPYRLNMDGSIQKDADGVPIPNYSPDVIDGVSRMITGWRGAYTAGPQGQGQNAQPLFSPGWGHDESAKHLLNGFISLPGQSAPQDMQTLVNVIASNASFAPFISRRLIQEFVTSNPSPGYVERVARVFANDGTGTVGNLKAVIKAILLDPEARSGDNDPVDSQFGHVQEPFLYFAGILRATGTQIGNVGPSSTHYECAADNDAVQQWLSKAGQLPFHAPSVFNFYQFTNKLPDSNTYAPEMQIMTDSTVFARMDFLSDLLFGSSELSNDHIQDEQWQAVAQTAPSQLVADLSHYMMGETLDASTREEIASAVEAIPPADADIRIRQAIFLIAATGQYQTIR